MLVIAVCRSTQPIPKQMQHWVDLDDNPKPLFATIDLMNFTRLKFECKNHCSTLRQQSISSDSNVPHCKGPALLQGANAAGLHMHW